MGYIELGISVPSNVYRCTRMVAKSYGMNFKNVGLVKTDLNLRDNRNAKGRVLKPAPFQSSVKSGEVARVEPNKKWFGEFT